MGKKARPLFKGAGRHVGGNQVGELSIHNMRVGTVSSLIHGNAVVLVLGNI